MPRSLALVGVALLTLLAVVAAASRGREPLAGDGDAARAPGAAFYDYVFTLLLVGLAFGAVAVAWFFANQRGRGPGGRRSTGVLGIVLFTAFMLGIFLAVRLAGGPPRNEVRTGNAPTMRTATGAGPPKAERADERRSPQINWPLLVTLMAAGAVALTALVVYARRQRPQRLDADDAELVDDLTTVLDETLDDLRAEPDPRRAVIAAYARMERALARHGMPREPFEAPLEYLERIAPRLRAWATLAERLVFELTHLYERAKFSPHRIDTQMKHEAIETLTVLREELRATAELAEAS